MKTRTGFISNSSSSSFVIRGSEVYPSIAEVAKAMIHIRDEDWDWKSNAIKVLHKYVKLIPLKDVGLYFKSTNYDTFIYEIDGYYFIKTCNNNNFIRIFTGADFVAIDYNNEQLWEKLNELGIEDIQYIEYVTPKMNFINLDSNFIGREICHEYFCEEHKWVETWLKKIKDEYILWCPSCNKKMTLSDDEKKSKIINNISKQHPDIINKVKI